MKRQILGAAILAAMAPAAYAGDIIAVDTDGFGSGDAAVSDTGALGWNNGNALAVDAIENGFIKPIGTIFQSYAHAALANLTDSNGNVITPPGIGSRTYEWTYVAGFQEKVVNLTSTPNRVFPADADFQLVAGGNNFFKIYYDTSADANNLTGKGFNDGLLILSGAILPFDAATGLGSGSFSVTALPVDGAGNPNSALDQFGADNYPGIYTVTGNGSTDIVIRVAFADSDFFAPGLDLISLNFDTFQNIPFQQQQPSSCFWTGSAYITGAGTVTPANINDCEAVSSVGSVNGVTGPNVIFETRSSNDFAVPEPGSLLLLGLGLAGLGGTLRRRNIG